MVADDFLGDHPGAETKLTKALGTLIDRLEADDLEAAADTADRVTDLLEAAAERRNQLDRRVARQRGPDVLKESELDALGADLSVSLAARGLRLRVLTAASMFLLDPEAADTELLAEAAGNLREVESKLAPKRKRAAKLADAAERRRGNQNPPLIADDKTWGTEGVPADALTISGPRGLQGAYAPGAEDTVELAVTNTVDRSISGIEAAISGPEAISAGLESPPGDTLDGGATQTLTISVSAPDEAGGYPVTVNVTGTAAGTDLSATRTISVDVVTDNLIEAQQAAIAAAEDDQAATTPGGSGGLGGGFANSVDPVDLLGAGAGLGAVGAGYGAYRYFSDNDDTEGGDAGD